MAIIEPGETIIGHKIRKKLGQTSVYGCHQYGRFYYGEDDDHYGVYLVRRGVAGQLIIKRRFAFGTNPQTVPQQANRQVYADGVVAWQNLTDEQKSVYNDNAKRKGFSGYNLFLREYLLSN